MVVNDPVVIDVVIEEIVSWVRALYCSITVLKTLFPPSLTTISTELENQYYRTNGAVATTRYALRSMRDGARKETVCPINNATDADSRPKSTSNASEMDEDEYVGSESEGSNDSWTTEESSSSFTGRYAPHNRTI
uniref:Uncharacterized protein n=1 Tax=Glossina pallidipes TaxID=7398 RepID=A0A1A9ZAY0_GLOPL